MKIEFYNRGNNEQRTEGLNILDKISSMTHCDVNGLTIYNYDKIKHLLKTYNCKYVKIYFTKNYVQISDGFMKIFELQFKHI